jgi:DNA ligase 1
MFKPCLADPPDPKFPLRFPLLVSPKLDGIRCVITPEGPRTRSLKRINNEHVEKYLSLPELAGLDGELVWGNPTDPNVIQNSTSAIMAKKKPPKPHDGLTFFVFDDFTDPDAPFVRRLQTAREKVERAGLALISFLLHETVYNEFDLDMAEQQALRDGYEGLMLRDPNGIYKYGRSTAKEGILLKLKRFEDTEGTVIGFAEKMHNANEAQTSELGRTKRSSAKAGKVGMGVVGAVDVRCPGFTSEFSIGIHHLGIPMEGGPSLIDRAIKFKFQPHGVKDAPRSPIFLDWRAD